MVEHGQQFQNSEALEQISRQRSPEEVHEISIFDQGQKETYTALDVQY
jgi:hypothetical protein